MNDVSLAAQFDDAEPIEEAPLTELDIEIDVTFQKKRFTSLHLEEPTIANIERAERQLNVPPPQISAYHIRQYQIELVAAVAKVPREVVLALKEHELDRAMGFLTDIRERNQRTASTSSPMSLGGGAGGRGTAGT